jgi:hypothetical protein
MKNIQVVSVSRLDESDKLLLGEAESTITSSIETARDFCKTLIGFSSGSIPVYFGILKYLGVEQIAVNSLESRIGILPPIFFLASIILSTITLIPKRFSVRPVVILTDYKQVRNRIASTLRRGIIFGSIAYVLGLSAAVFVFIMLLV